ncbi:imidazole glycerol phosphate synthase subunit HisH [Undibacterium sp. Jales W-56]|uniref:imidazole glycerol phosphate synthase subunit HisH n=1 Tax=Undibacterium sp. Jales W-56 TaxID=2897325 RepID=UPI0021D1A877|nr:imidazole glycerol phosphate synthase subunit HisH [Undibacterium sp. Jales W-56]MCU6433905.1 imidazole glycerol phosphate synthase subunit HisH [Undibacterium sp. Jales W-56]
MISIVDYGLGNVQAFANIYKRLDIPVTLAKTADDLATASHIILPGVGAFDWAMTKLNNSGMRETLDDLVLREKKPVLGICVGMQMMAMNSDEGKVDGLAWFDASVKLFDESRFQNRTHLPHMGWNDVEPIRRDGLFRDFDEGARFYFLHSYYFEPKDTSDMLSTTIYGDRFISGVQRGNVIGVQFHPEKSHGWGIQLLKNFAGL